MPKPPECTAEIYEQVMLKTWASTAEERPTFESLHEFFEEYYNMTDSNYRQSNSFDSPHTRSPERPSGNGHVHHSPARRNAPGVPTNAVASQLRSLPGGNAPHNATMSRDRDRNGPSGGRAAGGAGGAHTNPIIT